MKKLLAIIITILGLTTSAQAETYYYFEKMPGLIKGDGVTESPFGSLSTGETTGESSNPNLLLETVSAISMTTGQAGSTINVNLTSSTISDFTGATLTATSGANAIVTVSKSGSENTWEVVLTRVAGAACSTTLTLEATVGTETSSLVIPVDITLFSVCNADPLSVMEQDVDGNYLIGGAAGSSSQAKEELLCMSNIQTAGVLSASYKMTADVSFSSDESQEDWDMDGSADGTGTAGWNPIGVFTGVFNGSYNTISNLYSNKTVASVGFFSALSGASVKNLNMYKSYIHSTSSSIGGIAGSSSSGANIENISITNSDIYGYISVGGVVGVTSASAVLNQVEFTGAVSAWKQAGGVAGVLNGGTTINNAYTAGYVTSRFPPTGSDYTGYAGGIAGILYGVLNNSYSTATVYAKNRHAGGLAGSMYLAGSQVGTIYNSYVRWTTAPKALGQTVSAGALIGYNYLATIQARIINYNGLCKNSFCSEGNSISIQDNGNWDSAIWDLEGDNPEPTLKIESMF